MPALWLITFTISVQVSATEFNAVVGVAHEMDFLSPVLASSCNQFRVLVSGLGIYRHLI